MAPNDGQDFEALVELIERSIQSPNATIERDARIPELVSQNRRQVDVWVTIDAGHSTLTVAAEAKDHRRPVDIKVMEQTIAKHDKLGTSQLVIYSKSGFSQPAKDEAARCGVTTISPTELVNGAAERVIAHKLGSVWFKGIGFTASACRLFFRVEGQEIGVPATPGVNLYTKLGEQVMTALQVANGLCQSYINEHHLDLVRDVAETTGITGRLNTVERPACHFGGRKTVLHALISVGKDEGSQDLLGKGLVPVERIEVDFDGKVTVSRMGLDHQQFGDAAVSHGASQDASIAIVTIDGETKATVKLTTGETGTSQWIASGVI